MNKEHFKYLMTEMVNEHIKKGRMFCRNLLVNNTKKFWKVRRHCSNLEPGVLGELTPQSREGCSDQSVGFAGKPVYLHYLEENGPGMEGGA